MIVQNSLRTLAAAILTASISTSTSHAARRESAKLTLAENKVTVAGQPKPPGSTIAPGETIVTGARSRAEVTLPDGTVARIGQGSSFSYDGLKLRLNQGSALFNIAGKNSRIVTPALTRTGSAGVVSVHASQNYNALFALKGNDTVNGTPLVAGQAWVSERGAARTFTFDMQKMVGTSTLVTKFPQTPWVAQTTALASVQHQLIAAIKAQPAPAGQRPVITTAANGSTVVTVGRSGGTPGFLGRLASAFSGKPVAGAGTQGGTFQTSGATLVVNGSSTRTSGGTLSLGNSQTSGGALLVNGASTYTGGLVVNSAVSAFNGAITGGGSTLSISNNTLATISGTTLNNLTAGGSIDVNPNTGVAGVTNLGGLVRNGVGTLVLNGANTYSGTTAANTANLNAVNAITVPTIIPTNNSIGTLTVTNAGATSGNALTAGTGTLVLTNGILPTNVTLLGGSSNTSTINGTGAGTTGNVVLTPTPAAH